MVNIKVEGVEKTIKWAQQADPNDSRVSEKAFKGALGSYPRQKEEQARNRDCAGLSRGQEASVMQVRTSEKLPSPWQHLWPKRKNNTVLQTSG